MASTKQQKPTNDEHKFSQKISEVGAWGNRVFGHKQQEHPAAAKHCSTCQCSNTKPTTPKKEHATTKTIKDMKTRVCTHIIKKKTNEEQGNTPHKDAKHSSSTELTKKDKQHTPNVETKGFKQSTAGSETKMKEKKEHHAKINTTNAGNISSSKETGTHHFSNMADRLKEKIATMKKSKDVKSQDGSDSDSEDKTGGKTKQKKNRNSQEIKASSK